jgi:uncharacterized protein
MGRWLSMILLFMGVFLISCSPLTSQTGADTPNQGSAPAFLGQTLPISAQAVVPNNSKIDLEVATSPQQQEIGLMYRTSLADNRGMLFQFSTPLATSFWMKNTLIPLDIVFMRQGKVLKTFAAVPPCKADPCPTYGPNALFDQVIELRSGRAAQLGLQTGSKVKIEFLPLSPK